MKIMSPAFWLKYHAALLIDGVSATIAYWHTNTTAVKMWIIGDAVLLAFLLFLFSVFQGGQQ